MFKINILVESCLWQRQQIRILVEGALLSQTTSILGINSIHILLYLTVTTEVEPALSFESKLQAALMQNLFYHIARGIDILQVYTLTNLIDQRCCLLGIALMDAG